MDFGYRIALRSLIFIRGLKRRDPSKYPVNCQ